MPPRRMIECASWGGASPEVVAPLVARETQLWRTRFGWDLARDWAGLEAARVDGRVQGVLAHSVPERGDVGGWAFHVDSGPTRLVGALIADDEVVTNALVRAVLTAGCPDAVLVFVRDAAPGLAAVLAEQSFQVEGYTLLSRPVSAGAAGDQVGRTWDASDLAPAAALLCEAYEKETPLRPFAPGGQPAEWHDYVCALTERPGCGVFAPHLSVVVPTPGSESGASTLDGLVMTTLIGPAVAQLAQVAIAPRARRQHLGARLLDRACRLAGAAGCRHVTLLVADTNVKAGRLYAAAGFTPVGTFVAARRSTLTIHQHRA